MVPRRCYAAACNASIRSGSGNRTENTAEILRSRLPLHHQECVRNADLPPSFLGRVLDAGLVGNAAGAASTFCGENGEYHTIVLDRPLFHFPVPRRLP